MIHGTGTLETSPSHGLLPSFPGADGQRDYPPFPGAVGSGSLDSSRNLLITGASGQLRTGRGASSFSLSRPPPLTPCRDHQEDLTSAVGRKGPQGRLCLSPGIRGSERAVSTGGTGSCWGNKPPPSSAAQPSGLCLRPAWSGVWAGHAHLGWLVHAPERLRGGGIPGLGACTVRRPLHSHVCR